MVRGTLYLLLPDKRVISTTEFNGGMDPFQHGLKILAGLREVKSVADFIRLVVRFNNANHGYQERLIHDFKHFYDKDNFVDFRKNYYDRFFSDYLYIKNLSGMMIDGIDEKRFQFTIHHEDTIIMNFAYLKYRNNKMRFDED